MICHCSHDVSRQRQRRNDEKLMHVLFIRNTTAVSYSKYRKLKQCQSSCMSLKKKRPCFVMFTNHGSIWWFKTWDFLVCCRTRDQTGQITRTSSNQKVCHLVPTRTRQDHTKWWIKIHSEQNQSSLPGGPRAVFFSAKGRKPKTWFKYPTFSCVRIIKDLHHFQGYAYSKNTAVDRQCNMFSLATCQLGQWT